MIQVLLYKTTGVNFSTGVQYRGAAGAIDGIDLGPFLGDEGSVRTTKGVDEPCGGFTVVFADRVANEGADTVYALAEAMDMVEIRMKRIPPGVGALCPLVMRGFISKIRRDETIAADGRPQRVVIIEGQDMTKLWFNWSVLPEAQMAGDLVSMLSTYNLFAAAGIEYAIRPVAQFVRDFTETIMNAAVARFSTVSGVAIPPFDISRVTVPDDQGLISAAILQGFPGGTYWDVVDYVADRPWNELWVFDPPDGGNPQLIFRPVPYFDTGGGLIMPGAEDPGTITWDIGEIVSLSSVRSDHRVANFYWVPPGTSLPDSAGMTGINSYVRLGGPPPSGPMWAIDHDNSNMAIYGLRKMQHDTRLIPSEIPEPRSANLNTPGVRIEAGDITTLWNLLRCEQLRDLNWDNSVWETTEMVVKGHEDLIPGVYLEWTRGQFRGSGLVSKAYIYRVAHTWVPLKSGTSAGWLTTLTLERGNGFLNRDGMGASPYWAEGRRGPYSPTS
jgi:hypothetical protein